MIVLKNERDLDAMRPAGAVAGTVLEEIAAFIKPGLTTRQVDEFAAKRIKQHGAKSAFLGYRNYPCHTCLSVNEEVVHGLAGDRELHFGDIISVDVGVYYKGFVGDTARTVAVGGCGVAAQRLMDVTEHALGEGIAAAVPETGSRIFRARFKPMSKPTALAWYANLWGTAWGVRCMRNPRCRILSIRRAIRSSGPA